MRTKDPADIMTRPNPGPGFIDGCAEIDDDQTCQGAYEDISEDACDDDDFQQAHKYLLWLFGPAPAPAPDVTPPVVAIASPVEGQTFSVGADVAIAAEATDDIGVVDTRLYSNGGLIGSVPAPPSAWTLAALPAGTYALTFDAVDAPGNLGVSAPVTVTLVEGPSIPPAPRPTMPGHLGADLHRRYHRANRFGRRRDR